jgi:pimeloyl-ACP methyl ester carboxylesterase/ubiquinone/menaquinone biosynthesis C-methylase UbiE
MLKTEPRESLLEGLPVQERRLTLNGLPTAVLEGGDGAPMVLLHGPGEYAAKWLRVIPELVRTHRVIAPDLPGHGSSGVLEGAIDPGRVLDWLDELVERTCASAPVLVGQIVGGAIAARFAAQRGERVKSLVLVDALGLAAFQPSREFGQALREFMSEPGEETHDRLWRRCAFRLDDLRERLGKRWESIKAYNLDRARAPELRATQHALMEHFGFPAIAPEELDGIAVPTTLIWGRHDLATALAVAQAAAARHGWPLHVIDNAGDDPPLEQPEAFLQALRIALESTRADWDRIAPGYDEFVTPSHMALAREGLARVGLREGMRFLDVAAGSGALSIPAARLGAKVLATDQSPSMLGLLRRRIGKEALDIETRVMDGHALALGDDTFDVAGSQFGVMLFPQMPRGIREMARVVKPGGSVLVHAYGDPGRIEFLGFLARALRTVRPAFGGLPADPPPLPFQLQDPARLRAELVAAGLEQVRVETVTETMEFAPRHSLWDWIVSSNPIAQAMLSSLGLTAGETRAVRQALEDLVRARADSTGVARLTSPVNIGLGTK